MWRVLGSMCGLGGVVLAGSEAGEGQGPTHTHTHTGLRREADDKLT